MKACVLESVGNLVFKDVPIPKVGDGDVLLKVMACGICSSDFDRVLKTGTYNFPTIPGHEFSGKIIKVGKNVDCQWLNKRVVVFPLKPCFKCESCKQHLWQQCLQYDYCGSRSDGAFAEYISVPVWNIKEIPDNLPYSVAALVEPTAVAVHAVRAMLMEKTKVDKVAISGSGTIAILTALYARSLGIRDVVVLCRNEKKTKFIRSLGLETKLITECGNSHFYDTVIECVGSQDSIVNSLDYVAPSGTLIMVGNPSGDVCLPKQLYWRILRAELTIKGIWNSSWKNGKVDDWSIAVSWLSDNCNLVSRLISVKYRLSDADKPFIETLEKSSSKHSVIKAMYVNEDAS